MIGTDSLVAVLVLACAFIAGRRVGMLDRNYRGRRRFISAAAGASVAYIFIHVLPELSEFQARFAETVSGRALLFPEYRVYSAALFGFVLFYGIENMAFSRRLMTHCEDFKHNDSSLVWTLQLGGFTAYCGLISYLMVDWTHGSKALALYCVAMVFHFLIIDHALRAEHGAAYDSCGRWWLAAAVVVGWALAKLSPIPASAMATLQGFVAGGVTINSVKDEMPKSGEGRFAWFALGAFIFAMLMLVSNR